MFLRFAYLFERQRKTQRQRVPEPNQESDAQVTEPPWHPKRKRINKPHDTQNFNFCIIK